MQVYTKEDKNDKDTHYKKVASINTSYLKALSRFYKLLIKEKFNEYLPLKKKQLDFLI